MAVIFLDAAFAGQDVFPKDKGILPEGGNDAQSRDYDSAVCPAVHGHKKGSDYQDRCPGK